MQERLKHWWVAGCLTLWFRFSIDTLPCFHTTQAKALITIYTVTNRRGSPETVDDNHACQLDRKQGSKITRSESAERTAASTRK